MSRRIKRLRYYASAGTNGDATAAHWANFEFEAGPWVCSWLGPWGEVQVWAASPSEARRVVDHVAAAPGSTVAALGSPAGQWLQSRSRSGRNGRTGRFGVAMGGTVPIVTSRNGPSGNAVTVSGV